MADVAEHLTCQDVVELVTDYLEHALPSDDASLFEQHLNFCEGCVTYVDQMRLTIAAVGRISHEQLPAAARDQLLTAFRAWRTS